MPVSYTHLIVKRDGGDNHKGGHAGVSVNVLDKGDTQNSGGAPVGGLDEFPLKGFVFQQEGKPHGRKDADQSGAEAEKGKFSIPYVVKILSLIHI